MLHVARAGDDLPSLAARFGLTTADIMAANPGRSWGPFDWIRTGEVLAVPSGTMGDGGFSDFSSLIAAEPSAASSWSGVQAQLTAEGNGPGSSSGVYALAQQNFYSAWTNLATQTGASSSEDLQAISTAAGDLLMNTSTIAGAVRNVEGLIAGASSGNPVAIVQSVTGTIVSGIGLGIAAGAVSLGVGAAIVFGLEIAASAFASLFGQSAPAATLCGSQISGSVPTFAVGCVGSWGAAIKGGPGSKGAVNPYWRRFPEPTRPTDGWWFLPIVASPGGQVAGAFTDWTSGLSTDQWFYAGGDSGVQPNTVRPIDRAFPQYHQLECDMSAVALAALAPIGGGHAVRSVPVVGTQSGTFTATQVAQAQFMQAFFAAWKANHEYELNGLAAPTAQGIESDAVVLAQVVKFWNDAHESAGAGDFVLSPRNTSQSAYQTDVVSPGATCQGDLADEYYYAQMLLPYVAAQVPNPPTNSSGAITIHAGARKSGTLVASAGASSSSSTSTIATVTVTTAVVAGIGAIIWAALGKPFTMAALKAAFKGDR